MLYESVSRCELVPGVTYRVKHYGRELGYLIFTKYEDAEKLRILGKIPMSNIRLRIFNENHSFSRVISPEEFRAKRKEVFDRNVLTLILKNIVDENFSW